MTWLRRTWGAPLSLVTAATLAVVIAFRRPPAPLSVELASRLIDTGITELTFVGQKPEEVAPHLDQYAIDEQRSYVIGRWEMSVLVARP